MSDLISRQAAIDALDGEITVTGRVNAEAVRGYANLVCDRIKRLPSAQPERKKGKWIFKEDFRIVDGYDWKCDQCGSWQRYTSNYCPKCGARMEGCDD